MGYHPRMADLAGPRVLAETASRMGFDDSPNCESKVQFQDEI